jgi:hypothetical protein
MYRKDFVVDKVNNLLACRILPRLNDRLTSGAFDGYNDVLITIGRI